MAPPVTIAGIVSVALLALLVVVLWQLPAKACCHHEHALEAPPWKRGIHWREWHHGYALALAPLLVGAIVELPAWWKALPALALAFVLWCYVDDLRQHLTQLRDPGKRYHRSPLKRFAERTWYRWRES